MKRKNQYSNLQWKDHKGNIFESQKAMCNFWNIHTSTFQNRIKYGWSLEQALTKNIKYKKNKLNNTPNNISKSSIRYRMTKLGMTYDEAVTLPKYTTSNKEPKGSVYFHETEYPSLSALCKAKNIKYATVRKRLKKGESLEQALQKVDPNYKSKKITYDGIEYSSIKQFCKETNIEQDYSLIKDRLKRGWDIEKAITTPAFVGKLIGKKNPVFTLNEKEYYSITCPICHNQFIFSIEDIIQHHNKHENNN